MMKACCLFSLFSLLSLQNLLGQKVVLNEAGFRMEEKDRNDIEMLAQYEAMIYNGLFNTRKNDSLLITINIYKKFSDYKKACQETGYPMLSRTGFYSPGLRTVFVYKHPGFMVTLVHEMSHSFMRHNMSNPPRWLNEGIAVFFESLSVENGQVSVTTQPGRTAAVKRELNEGNIHLEDFFRLDDGAWQNKSTLDYMYNVSYSIIFLITKTNPDITKRIILALKKGYDSTRAIESVYGSVGAFALKYRLFYQ